MADSDRPQRKRLVRSGGNPLPPLLFTLPLDICPMFLLLLHHWGFLTTSPTLLRNRGRSEEVSGSEWKREGDMKEGEGKIVKLTKPSSSIDFLPSWGGIFSLFWWAPPPLLHCSIFPSPFSSHPNKGNPTLSFLFLSLPSPFLQKSL